VFQFPESEQIMTILSAQLDFVHRTLAALPGSFSKLVYLARLRNSWGEYEHWGLARTHGELPAKKAIEQAHTEMFLEVLRMPLAKLVSDYESFRDSGDDAWQPDLFDEAASLVPRGLGGGGRKHFKLIVNVLWSLEHSRASARSRAA
jgi:hypothetical protein